MVRVFVLMGGMWGFDGSMFSRGMVDLSERINKLDGVTSTYHYWSSWATVQARVREVPQGTKVAVVGYSGGGSRLTWMTTKMNLAVGYDASPIHQVKGVRNYERALCYHNTQVNYILGFRLGGGLYAGSNVETTEINMSHMAVQYSEMLHQQTIMAIKRLRTAASA